MDSLFIDVSNLNVVFKVKGRFCFAANYANAVEQLIIDAQALGSSFDVYVSMLPRKTGDHMLSGLSLGGVPFYVLEDEMRAVLSFVQKIPGANSIYVCNALANFIIPARVQTFSAVIPYGDRYAFIEVKDRMLEGMKVFHTQADFYEAMGDGFSCYGDFDLVDTDTLRAQYPELEKLEKKDIVPLASMVASYRSPNKMLMEDVLTELSGAPLQREPTEPVVQRKKEAPLPDYSEDERPPEKPIKVKKPWDWVSFTLGIVACLALFVSGVGYKWSDVSGTLSMIETSRLQYTAKDGTYAGIQSIYDAGLDTARKVSEVLEYAKGTEIAVTVSSVDAYLDRITVRFSTNDDNAREQFLSYLRQKFVVGDVNNFGSTTTLDGQATTEYGAVIVP